MQLIFILIAIPLFIASIDFIGFLIKGKRVVHFIFRLIAEIGAFLILPYLYLSFDTKNNCCGDSAAFSPDHQVSMWVLIGACLMAYFYCSFRKKIAAPILEILVNGLLLVGIVLNILIAIHTKEIFLATGGNLPIILLALLALAKNQQLFVMQSAEALFDLKTGPGKFAWKILHLRPILKFPIIFIICLPILIIISGILLLVGQKPDSLVRAFTDTYKHGFSQWDYKCDNVQCGGHYLCSVAANGHAHIVKPRRLGVRNNQNIICNRQLLIANAFEDLLEDKIPFIHRPIRKLYNRVGNFIHRYYAIFNNKLIADIIYVAMKPVEWLFLIALYTCDRKPENRIARQYISQEHRQQLNKAGVVN